jgi:predicted enzyme related to lactoylglutathione lyase
MWHGLRTKIFVVPDLGLAKAWYADATGVAPAFDESFYVGFTVGGFELGLVPAGEDDQATTYWGVDDVGAEVTRLTELGAELIVEPKNVGGEVEVAVMEDPFGNRFGLIYNPEFGADSGSSG